MNYKKLVIVNNEHFKHIITAITNYISPKDKKVEIIYTNDLNSLEVMEDTLIITINQPASLAPQLNKEINTTCLNLHFSLLPAFKEDDAIYKSFTSGIKVGGISIHEITNDNFFGRIHAQYPVLIGIDTHFDQYQNELISISSQIYPIVIDSILNNKVFDFKDLFKTSCHKNNGCSGKCSC